METSAAEAASGLGITRIIDAFGMLDYVALALLAIWGVYNAVLLYRSLKKKGLSQAQAEALLEQTRNLCLGSDGKLPNPDAAVAVCQNPPYWHAALAQLIGVALRNRGKGLAKVKQLLITEFHTRVVGGMESRLASIATAAKLGPLLGLLGTVMSMIAAFGRMGEGQKADPSALAGAISLGLWTTAAGLIIATPLMMLSNDIQARLRRLRDETERHLQDAIEILEQMETTSGRNAPGSRSGTMKAVLPR